MKIKAKKQLKLFSFTSFLMLGTSLGGTYCVMEKFQPEQFSDKIVKVNDVDIPINEFYEKLEKKNNVWYLQNFEKNRTADLYKFTDYRSVGDIEFRSYSNDPLKEFRDTVYIHQYKDRAGEYYSMAAADSIAETPNLGYFWHNQLHVREFVSDNPSVAARYEYYNDKYNCTWRHEYQHFLNSQAGVNCSGQSYETKYAEMCMDEVSANIAQLLEQRNNYLENGRNSKYLTVRFEFYKKWVESLKQPLPEEIAPEEEKFIALGVLEMWKEKKFPIYAQKSGIRAYNTLRTAHYDGCVDHPLQHRRLMYKMFQINGIDFFKYLEGSENYFKELIPEDFAQKFAEAVKIKKDNVGYLQKVSMKFGDDIKAKDNFFTGLKMKHRWNKFLGRE